MRVSYLHHGEALGCSLGAPVRERISQHEIVPDLSQHPRASKDRDAAAHGGRMGGTLDWWSGG